MKNTLIIAAVCGVLSSQAGAWGLGDLGGKVLQGAVTGAVSGKNSDAIKQDATQNATDEVSRQADENAQANAVDPNTLEGAATNIAADAASQTATNALSKTGIPGAAAIGAAAGSIVKGFGGMFKKKQAEPQPTPTQE